MPLIPDVPAALRDRLPRWSVEDAQIVRTYETGDWTRGQMLLCAIGYLAESAGHHPDLLLTYPRLRVALSTHDEGGITEKDVALAERIESIAESP